MRRANRTIAFLLVVAMLVIPLPITAFSAIAVNADDGVYETISAGETKTAVINEDSAYAYFRFEPTEDGYYTFYSTADADTYGYIYDADMNELMRDDDGGENNNFLMMYRFEAGKTYILAARYYYSDTTGSFAVCLIETPKPTEMYLNHTISRGLVGGGVYLYAIFGPDNTAPEEVATWTSSDPSVATVSSEGEVAFLSIGEAVITAISANGLTATCAVAVVEPQILQEDVPTRVTIVDNNEEFFYFTPSEDGYYVFYCTNYSNENEALIRLWGSFGMQYSDDGKLTSYLEAGTRYQLSTDYTSHIDAGNGEFDLVVSKAVPPTSMSFSSEVPAEVYVNTAYELTVDFAPWNALPGTVTWTSSDESIATVSYSYNNYAEIRFLQKAGTVTITAAEESGASVSCTIQVDDYEAILVGETKTAVHKKMYDYVYYRFTPTEDGYYTFYSIGCTTYNDRAYGYIYDENFIRLAYALYGGDDYNFLLNYYFEAGKTYILGTRYYNDVEAGSYDVALIKSPAATEMTLNPTTSRGLVGAGVYLNAYFTPSNAAPEEITWTSSDPSVATVDEYGLVSFLAGGEAVITATSENGLTATCVVTVIEPQVLQEDVAVRVTVIDNNEEYFNFTPSESGYYVFLCSNFSNENSAGIRLAASYGWVYSDSEKLIYYLEAGTTYLLYTNFTGYSGTGNGEYDLVVTKGVSPTDMTISVDTDEVYVNTYYNLTVDFEPWNAAPGTITWETSDETIARVSYTSNNYAEIRFLNKAGEVVTITATAESGISRSCTFRVKDYDPIFVDERTTVTIENGGDYVYYKFIPTEDGYYTFYSIGCSYRAYGDIYDENWNYLASSSSGNGYNFVTKYCFEAGKTYILGTCFSGSWTTGSYDVCVIKSPAATSVNIVLTYRGFVGDRIGLSASFEPIEAAPESLTWSSSDSGIVTVSPYGDIELLKSGEAVITAISENGLTASCVVTVVEPQILQEDVVSRVTITDNNEERFYFTPSESGDYVFYCSNYSNRNSAWLSVRVSTSYWVGDSDTGRLSCYLQAGTKYTLSTAFSEWYVDDDGEYDLVVAKAVPPASMTISADSAEVYINTYYDLSVEFEPWNALPEKLTWTSSDESIAVISYSYDNYAEIRFLKNAGTVTITATAESGVSRSCTFLVKDYDPIFVDETTTVVIENAGDRAYFKFLPAEDGYYSFYSSASRDTFGSIYNADMNVLAEDDDSGNGTNFLVKYYLEAGKTYIFEARYLSPSLTGSFDVCVIKSPAATELTIVPPVIRAIVGGNTYLSVFYEPLEAAPEELTWSSSDPSVAIVSPDGFVEFLKAGEAIITATSTNGLTATCVVTVVEPQVLQEDVITKVTIEDNEEAYFYFTPSESGNYVFYCSNYLNGYSVRLILKQSDSYWLADSYDGKLTYYLTAGTRYLLATNFNDYIGDGDGEYDLVVSKAVPPASMTISKTSAEVRIYTWYSLSVEFAPWNAINEMIAWTSSDESIAVIEYTHGNNETYAEIRFLDKAGTVTITARSESGLSQSCTFQVSGFETIVVDETKTAVIESAGDMVYYKFTPTEDGYYSFYSTGIDTYSDRAYGYIYDENMSYVTSSTGGGSGYNFSVKFYMEAGKTYILATKYYYSDTTGSIDVCVAQTKGVTALKVVSLPDRNVYVKGYVSLELEGLELEVTWSGGSVTSWRYGYDSYNLDGEWINFDDGEANYNGTVYVSCGRAETSFTLTLIDDPVESIELVTGTAKIYIEHYDGYYFNGEEGGDYYYYTEFPYDAVIRIIYKDGTTKTANVGDDVDGYNVGWSHNQYGKPWTVGSDNESTISYLGHTVNLPITVAQNTVASIEVVSGKVTCIERANGYERADGSFFYYYTMPADVMVKITYTDGTSKTVGIREGADGYSFDWEHDQYDTPWVLGDDNYITISYLGATAKLPVSIIANPVDHIEINSAPTREYVYGDTKYGYLYSDGTYEFYPTDMTGLSFTVYYTDGTSKTYTDADINKYDGTIDGYSYGLIYDGYDPAIGDFPVTFTYMGKRATYTVRLVAASGDKPFLFGDVNGDGVVNGLDRMVLDRYLAEWEDYQDIDLRAADVNQDGVVNNLDRMILTRHLAEWEDYATLPHVE